MDQGAATVLAALITSSAAIVVALVTSRRKHHVAVQPAGSHESNLPPLGLAGRWFITSFILLPANFGAATALVMSDEDEAILFSLFWSAALGGLVWCFAVARKWSIPGAGSTIIALFYWFILVGIRKETREAGFTLSDRWVGIWLLSMVVLFLVGTVSVMMMKPPSNDGKGTSA